MTKPFIKCDQCGLCCHFCHTHPDLREYNRGDGVCIHLQPDKSCGIYDTRPDICNTRTHYNIYYKGVLSEQEYAEASEKSCNIIRGMFNHPPLD